jgi:adenylate cyclase, class 2
LIYDDLKRTFADTGKLLRLRTTRGMHLLTFKHPLERSPEGTRYKIRQEHQTVVVDREETEKLLEGLGFERVYRYQKFRQHYQLGEALIVIDEVPFGAYLELEGLPAVIDQAARGLGYTPDDYITDTYYELHCKKVGQDPPGDLVFPQDSAPR